MQTIKKNLLPTITIGLLFLITGVNILINYVSGSRLNTSLFSALIGFAFIILISLLKEEHLYKISIPAYMLSMVILAVPLFGHDYFTRHFWDMNYFMFYVPTVIPLAIPFISRSVVQSTVLSPLRFVWVCLLTLIPIGLVFCEPNLTDAFIAFLAFAIFVVSLKKEGRLKVSWRVLILPIIVFTATVIFYYPQSSYMSEKIQTILTRGANEPLGAGWVRTVLDGIFTKTPLIGHTHYYFGDINLNEVLNRWGAHNMMIILSEYGWLTFITTILLYAAFFFFIFKMISKMSKNSFGKYIALLSGLLMIIQSVYSIFGLFLLDCSPIDFPFISTHFTVNIMNYIQVAVIIMLYLKREEPSKIEQLNDASNEYYSCVGELISLLIFGDCSCDDLDDIDLDNIVEEISEKSEKNIEQ